MADTLYVYLTTNMDKFGTPIKIEKCSVELIGAKDHEQNIYRDALAQNIDFRNECGDYQVLIGNKGKNEIFIKEIPNNKIGVFIPLKHAVEFKWPNKNLIIVGNHKLFYVNDFNDTGLYLIDPYESTKKYPFPKPNEIVTIGRQADNWIQIPISDDKASGFHCQVINKGNTLYILDEKSTNSTWMQIQDKHMSFKLENSVWFLNSSTYGNLQVSLFEGLRLFVHPKLVITCSYKTLEDKQ